MSATLETWYDYGPGSPSCAGRASTVTVDWGPNRAINEDDRESQMPQMMSTSKIWYRYVMLVAVNILIVAMTLAIIHFKRRNLEKWEKNHKRKQQKKSMKALLLQHAVNLDVPSTDEI